MAASQTINTQEVTQEQDSGWNNFTDQNTQPVVWGRLHAKRLKIKSADISEAEFSVGRGKTNNLCITESALKQEYFLKLSKTHFVISRAKCDVLAPVYIQVLS